MKANASFTRRRARRRVREVVLHLAARGCCEVFSSFSPPLEKRERERELGHVLPIFNERERERGCGLFFEKTQRARSPRRAMPDSQAAILSSPRELRSTLPVLFGLWTVPSFYKHRSRVVQEDTLWTVFARRSSKNPNENLDAAFVKTALAERRAQRVHVVAQRLMKEKKRLRYLGYVSWRERDARESRGELQLQTRALPAPDPNGFFQTGVSRLDRLLCWHHECFGTPPYRIV